MTSEDVPPGAEGGPAGPELHRVRREFLAARGVDDDPRWAESALVTMVFADVQIDVAEEALVDAAALVRQSQESPEQLYGPPDRWASGTVESLRESGLAAFEDPMPRSLRGSVLTVFGVSAGLSALFVVHDLLSLLFGTGSGKGLTLGLAVAPLLLSTAIIILWRVHTAASRRFAFPAVVALSVLVLAACAVTTAAVIMPLGQMDPVAGRGWMVALVPLYGLIAVLLARLWPKPSVAPQPLTVPEVLAGGAVEDEQWLRRAQAALRERGDLPEKRISAALREAQDHAADHGMRLLEEFASPEEYARSLPRDPRVTPRRLTLLYGAVALCWLGAGVLSVAESGWEPNWEHGLYAVLVLLTLWVSSTYARSWRAASADAGGEA